MKIKIIHGKEEDIDKEVFEQALKLRYKIYRKMGFLNQNKEKRDYDDYDKEAIHIIALDGKKVVGYIRIIKNMPLMSIFKKEVEEILKTKKFKNPIEISRFVIAEDYRIGDKKIDNYEGFVSFLLFKKAYEIIVSRGIDSVFFVTNPIYKKRYETLYPFEEYGEEKSYDKVEGNPAVLFFQGINEGLEIMKKINKSFLDFINRNDE